MLVPASCNCLKPSCRWCRPVLARLAMQRTLRQSNQATHIRRGAAHLVSEQPALFSLQAQ